MSTVAGRYGRIHTRKCHCAMCGVDDAGRTTGRKGYRAVGIQVSEEGVFGASKRDARRLRRTREARQWREEDMGL